MASQEHQKCPSTFLIKKTLRTGAMLKKKPKQQNNNNKENPTKQNNNNPPFRISSHILKQLKSLHADVHFEMYQLPVQYIE